MESDEADYTLFYKNKFIRIMSRGGNGGEEGKGWGKGQLPPQLDMTRKILIKNRILLSWSWRKKSDSISDTVSIYVKFCNKIP